MYKISEVCKKFKLSRSTLLYYDSIGLLQPSTRTDSNYRLYSEADIDRLEQISIYKEAGIPLKEIADILASPIDITGEALSKRLKQISLDISLLKVQQQIIAQMLRNNNIPPDTDLSNKESLVTTLKSIGMDDGKMHQLHVEFERSFPEKHQTFLEFLGIPADEIRKIREHSI